MAKGQILTELKKEDDGITVHQQGDDSTDAASLEKWLAIRKQAGLSIDPETAEVMWQYALTLDPYGVHSDPPELRQVGRQYFARAPGSDVWVSFYNLPDATCKALWERLETRPESFVDDELPF